MGGTAVWMVVIGLLALWVILSGKGLATWEVWFPPAAAPGAAQSTAVLGA